MKQQHLQSAITLIQNMSGKPPRTQFSVIKRLWNIPGFINIINVGLLLSWTDSDDYINPLAEIIQRYNISDQEMDDLFHYVETDSVKYANILLHVGIADKSKQIELAKGHPDAFLIGLARELKEYGLRMDYIDQKALRYAISNSKLRTHPPIRRTIVWVLQHI